MGVCVCIQVSAIIDELYIVNKRGCMWWTGKGDQPAVVKKHELSSEFGTKFQGVAIIFGETLIFAT